jgi:poly(A) polymerase
MLDFFRRKKSEPPPPKRIREHQLGPSILDASALKVIEVLNSNGFQAYLVGGCVRDALCGVKPKDFDVATDAPLEAVSKLFRRSRIVGRRFPIVHVRFGRDLIEVSTFRQSISDKVVHDDRGMILRDNAFGTLQEDAFRRDFTVNALYYDPSNK